MFRLLILLLMVSWFWSANAQVRILPFGNSLVYDDPGDTRDDAFRAGFRRYLWYKLDSAGYNVDFVGRRQAGYGFSPAIDPHHEGWTGISDQWAAENIYQIAALNRPDIVLFFVGTNNVSYRTSATYIEQALSEIQRYETDSAQPVKVILALITNRNPYHANTTLFNNNVRTMATARIANGDNIVLADMENGIGMDYAGGDMANATHPSESGYYKMAQGWFSVLDTILPPPAIKIPAIVSTPELEAVVGIPYSYQLIASGYPAPRYRLVQGEPNFAVDSITGIVYGVPPSAGIVPFEVEAYNLAGSAVQSVAIMADSSFCPNGLAHHWACETTENSLIIDETGAVPLEPVGSVTISSGFMGNGLSLDGLSYIKAYDSLFAQETDTNSFSLGLWVRFTSVTGADKTFAAKYTDSSSSWVVGATSGTGRAFFRFKGQLTGSDSDTLLLGPEINDGTWHHLLVTRNGLSGWNGLYVDGTLADSGRVSIVDIDGAGTPFSIGARLTASGPEDYLTGQLDEITCYNQTLAAAEIAKLYAKYSAGMLPCDAENPAITSQSGVLRIDEDATFVMRRQDLLVSDTDTEYPGGFTLHLFAGDNYNVLGNTITPKTNFNGLLTVPVIVNDGKFASNQFNVQIQVDAVDDPPYVFNPLSDIHTFEDGSVIRRGVAGVFGDIDTPPASILKSVASVLPAGIVSASITNDTLILTPLPQKNGSVQLILAGTSGVYTVYDTLTVYVEAIDDAPQLTAIPDLTIAEGATFAAINLSSYLINYDTDSIVWRMVNTGSLGSVISGNSLQVTAPDINWNGSAQIIVIAEDFTSNRYSDADTIVFTITPVDDAPFVNLAIPNQILAEDASPLRIRLSDYFADIDNAINLATFSSSITPGGIIATSVIADTLVLQCLANKNGAVIVTVSCNSNGKTVTDQFNVLINAVNDPPLFTVPATVSQLVNFASPVIIELAKAPVPSDESAQIVQYSLSPTTADFANITINSLTGRISISSKPNLSGVQQFVVTANDQQSQFNLARDTLILTVSTKLAQVINFPAIGTKTMLDVPFRHNATANSGNPVTVEVVYGPVTLRNDTVFINGIGEVKLRASSPETPLYFAATPVERTFSITRISQTITFEAPDSLEFGGTPSLLTASASSGLTVSLSVISGPGSLTGNQLTVSAPGTILVRATQTGNSTYAAATPADQYILVTKRSQLISFEPPGDKQFGGAPFSLQASSTSGLPVSFEIVSGPGVLTGSLVELTGAGILVIKATQPGNSYYQPASPIEEIVNVSKRLQTIHFNLPQTWYLSAGSVPLEATASSGLPVYYTITDGDATITGNTLWPEVPGVISITASQPGNGDFEPAVPADAQIVIVVPAIDLSLQTIISPDDINNLLAGTPQNVTVSIYNEGQINMSDFAIAYITDALSLPVTEIYEGVLNANETLTYTFLQNWVPTGSEKYLKSYIVLSAADDVPSNDTLILARTTDIPVVNRARVLTLYPNPATDFVYLAGIAAADIEAISLTTFDGRVLVTPEIVSYGNEAGFEVTSLKPGVYLLVVNYRNGMAASTLIRK